MALGILAIGCGGNGDGGDTGGETRAVQGLDKCSVQIEGYYYLGAMLPYEGPWPVGMSNQNAIVQAVQEINEGGGVKDKPLGLVACNTKGDPTEGEQVLNEIVNATPTISAIVGAYRSAVTVPTSSTAIEEGIVMMSPGSTSPAITELEDDDWINRTAPSDGLQGLIASAIAQREGLSNVYVINIDDPYGNGLRRVFSEEFEAAGGTADFSNYDPSSSGYADTMVSDAMGANPDGVFLIGFFTDGASIVKTAINQGLNPDKWIFPDGLKGQEFIDNVSNDSYLNGSLGTVPASPTGPDYDAFQAKYNELWGMAPGAFNANSYDAVYLLAAAMELSEDPENRVQVRDNIPNTTMGSEVHPQEWSQATELAADGQLNYEGASGAVDINDKGDVVSDIEEWTVRDGMVETIGCWTPEAQPCGPGGG
jgi:ABC-type branched-subunit amino acid transport system substrate-binding protein